MKNEHVTTKVINQLQFIGLTADLLSQTINDKIPVWNFEPVDTHNSEEELTELAHQLFENLEKYATTLLAEIKQAKNKFK